MRLWRPSRSKTYQPDYFLKFPGKQRYTMYYLQHTDTSKIEAPVYFGTIGSNTPVYSRRIQE
jgi:hypothetical protein